MKSIKGAGIVKGLCLQVSCPMEVEGHKQLQEGLLTFGLGASLGLTLKEILPSKRFIPKKLYVAHALVFHLVHPLF